MNGSLLWWTLIVCSGVAIFSVVARRLGTATPIFMLLTGMIVSFVPGMPQVTLEPDLVLLVLLPPLLYSSGVSMSWPQFRENLRPILLLAIGCVLFTAAAVAAVGHYVLGLSWAVGFVLGAVVSPPDAVAPMAIARRFGLPRRLLAVLEGESLVNDATALVILGLAIGAVGSGHFSLRAAALEFVAIVTLEIAYGLAVGWMMLRLRQVANDPRSEIVLALCTPFVAFWPPHALGGSGVIACVVAGFYVSWNGPRFIRSATRLQGYFIWDLVNWVCEAVIFLLTGLAARSVFVGLDDSIGTAMKAALVVSLTVIVVRFIWVFPATYLPGLLIRTWRKAPNAPGWRGVFMVGFTGLRGAVSLAAALAVPTTVMSGGPFPDRDLVLFVTFCVIFITLVGQGEMLPAVIRWLGLDKVAAEEAAAEKRNEQAARIAGAEATVKAIDTIDLSIVSPDVVDAVRRYREERRTRFSISADPTPADPVTQMVSLELRLIESERKTINAMFADGRLSDDARRRIERELDLEEARIRHTLVSAGAGAPGPVPE